MGLPLFLCALFFVFFTIRAQLFFFLNLVMGVSSQVIKFGRLNLLNSLLSVVCLLSFAVNCETSLDSFSKSDELNASRYQTWNSQLDLPLTHTRSINLNNKMTTCRNLFFFCWFPHLFSNKLSTELDFGCLFQIRSNRIFRHKSNFYNLIRDWIEILFLKFLF